LRAYRSLTFRLQPEYVMGRKLERHFLLHLGWFAMVTQDQGTSVARFAERAFGRMRRRALRRDDHRKSHGPSE
jgi:hypothetical protein